MALNTSIGSLMWPNVDDIPFLEEDSFLTNVIEEEIVLSSEADEGDFFSPQDSTVTYQGSCDSDNLAWPVSPLFDVMEFDMETVEERLDLDFLQNLLHDVNEEEQCKYDVSPTCRSNTPAADVYVAPSSSNTETTANHNALLYTPKESHPFPLRENQGVYKRKSKPNHSVVKVLPQSLSTRNKEHDHARAAVSVKRQEQLLSTTINNEDILWGKPGDILYLSDEEKLLLRQEGMRLFPTHLPLTRAEESLLRRVRRKIRNKHSAKLSRAKKQCFFEEIERRARACSQENLSLKRQVVELKTERNYLQEQVNQLKKRLSYYHQQLPHCTPFHSSTSLASTSQMALIVLFSLTLICEPMGWTRPAVVDKSSSLTPAIMPGRSRTLLSFDEHKHVSPFSVEKRSLDDALPEPVLNDTLSNNSSHQTISSTVVLEVVNMTIVHLAFTDDHQK